MLLSFGSENAFRAADQPCNMPCVLAMHSIRYRLLVAKSGLPDFLRAPEI